MNFFLKCPKNSSREVIFRSDEEIAQDVRSDNEKITLITDCFNNEQFNLINIDNASCYIIGDFIIPANYRFSKQEYLKEFFESFSFEKLRNAKGNFYLIIINRRERFVRITGSMMSILPVFYFDTDDCVYISSRTDSIISRSGRKFLINKIYILEYLIFGYAFQDNTLINEIRLLPANSYIDLRSGKTHIIKHTSITDYFTDKPLSWKRSVDALSDLFIERSQDYLPGEPYFSSVTGGLDSRTLLSIGLSLGKELTAYSYGGPDDKDIRIPSGICQNLGIPYQPFILDKEYAGSNFLDDAREANRISEGSLRFSRATYLLMAREISARTHFSVSGNFGSELLRTARMSGNVISETVFEMFESITNAEFAKHIKDTPGLRYIYSSFLKDELDQVVINCIDYRNNTSKSLSPTQAFYRFMFEEVFRKYFGAELVVEHKYLVNRTPFLDFVFMTEVMKSEMAGCNARFRVRNPLDRFTGQVLYPWIIMKTFPGLLDFDLDRDYSPGDFLKLLGKFRIAAGYLRRKFYKDRNRYLQPGYNKLAMEMNISRIDPEIYDLPFINKPLLTSIMNSKNIETEHIRLNLFFTLFDYIHQVLKTNENVILQ